MSAEAQQEQTMRAYRLFEPGRVAFAEIERPRPNRGEVLVRVTAAGLCHSDLTMIGFADRIGIVPPVTLGHESAGVVEEVGPGVDDWTHGQEVAIYSVTGCRTCVECRRGNATLCPVAMSSSGVHRDGGMATYMVADESQLVSAAGLDGETAAILTDAGVTAYSAVARTQSTLTASSTAAVIGIGGLGHMAVQILRALTPARIVAVDIDARKLELAARLGADAAIVGGDGVVERVRAEVPSGVDCVFDFVGTNDTLAAAAALANASGWIVLTGIADGALRFGDPAAGLKPEVKLVRTSYGTVEDLRAVIELARRGLVAAEIVRYPLSDAPRAFADLDEGRIVGRAVLTPVLSP